MEICKFNENGVCLIHGGGCQGLVAYNWERCYYYKKYADTDPDTLRKGVPIEVIKKIKELEKRIEILEKEVMKKNG